MTTPVVTATPATTTSINSDLGKYVKELEGKDRKSAELLRLLQLAVEADEKEQCVFLDKEVIATSSSLIIVSVLVANKSERAIHFPIHLQYRARTVVTTALVDSGATGNFIDPSLIHQLLLPSWPIPPLQALSIDKMPNKQGQITTTTHIHCKATTVTVQMDPYPFPFTHNLHSNLVFSLRLSLVSRQPQLSMMTRSPSKSSSLLWQPPDLSLTETHHPHGCPSKKKPFSMTIGAQDLRAFTHRKPFSITVEAQDLWAFAYSHPSRSPLELYVSLHYTWVCAARDQVTQAI